MRLRRRDAPAREFLRRQHARPGVENLHRIGAGLQLPHQIARRRLDQHVDQRVERFGIAIGEHPRRRLIRRAAPGDHVGRDRPGRAAKAEQRHRRRQAAPLRAGPSRRPAPARRDRSRRQPLEIGAILDRIEPRTFAGDERHRLAERMRHHQDIREQDRGIETEAPDRLQRHFGRKLGIETQDRGSRRPFRAPARYSGR